MRESAVLRFKICVLVFAFGISLFLGMSSVYFSGTSGGSLPSYTRSIGVSTSPWLEFECRAVQTINGLACEEWETTVELRSWSWLALFISIGAGICALRRND